MSANKVSPTVDSLIAQSLNLFLDDRVPELESDPQKKISLSLNYASSFMIWEIRTAITAVWMMKSSPWRIGIECCATTRPVVSTKIVRDSTELPMRSLMPVDSLKTLSSCYPISKQYKHCGVFFCYAKNISLPFCSLRYWSFCFKDQAKSWFKRWSCSLQKNAWREILRSRPS